MSTHEYFDNAVTSDEIEFIRQFIRCGFNGERAARYTWGLSTGGAYKKSQKLLADPRIINAIAEVQHAAAEHLRIDATWVTTEAVELYLKCSRTEKMLDKHGMETGELRFDATNSIRALKLVAELTGNLTGNPEGSKDDQITARLQAARKRLASYEPHPAIPPADELVEAIEEPDEDLDTPEEPEISFMGEPKAVQHSDAVMDINDLVDEVQAEEKLKLLMERWRTGKPPIT